MNEEGQGPYRMPFAILAFNRSLKCKSSCIINCIKYNQMIKLEQGSVAKVCVSINK